MPEGATPQEFGNAVRVEMAHALRLPLCEVGLPEMKAVIDAGAMVRRSLGYRVQGRVMRAEGGRCRLGGGVCCDLLPGVLRTDAATCSVRVFCGRVHCACFVLPCALCVYFCRGCESKPLLLFTRMLRIAILDRPKMTAARGRYRAGG